MCSALSTALLRTRAHSPGEATVTSDGADAERGLELTRFLATPKLKLRDRLAQFSDFIAGEYRRDLLVRREVVGPMGRSVRVRDLATGGLGPPWPAGACRGSPNPERPGTPAPRPGPAAAGRPMLMFGSNNYLGLANDPFVRRRVRECLSQFGAGVAGPPMLNGTTSLHLDLEARLSRLKGAQSALLYSSGYAANIGWLAGLVGRRDAVVLDERSHASTFDGTKQTRGHTVTFHHNDVADLAAKLAALVASRCEFVNLFVSVRGKHWTSLPLRAERVLGPPRAGRAA